MSRPQSIPPSPGTYALLLRLRGSATQTVGRLGTIEFGSGWYVYVGSAFGPGGLQARVGRHLANDRKCVHWHIDYLRAIASVGEVWWTTDPERLEHEWACTLENSPLSIGIVAGFGTSDCRCASHLIRFKRRPFFNEFVDASRASISGRLFVERLRMDCRPTSSKRRSTSTLKHTQRTGGHIVFTKGRFESRIDPS